MKKSSSKHNTQYVSVSSSELMKGEVLLPGRHECLCEAKKHALINNCLHCGRIVCEQERSGTCFTCGNLVCTPQEQELIIRQSKAGFKLYNKLMNQDGGKSENRTPITKGLSLQTAVEHRDKLLEYDRNIEKRAKVIDDENDYFQTDSKWLSAKDRKILKEKEEEMYEQLHNRQNKKLTFDFAGRKIIEETPEIKIDIDELLKPDTSIFECSNFIADLPSDFNPVYDESFCSRTSNSQDIANEKPMLTRIQDKELQEMSDEGMCLSLHQPHASLLVAGIKKYEGRLWYTSYRGRLWIHSAGKQASQQEISDAEKLYKCIDGSKQFPTSYPAGCLLGCINLVECLPQEEYKMQYPFGEIADPYVFICENAQELKIKFPMKGGNKIFKLDKEIHQAAKKTLRKWN